MPKYYCMCPQYNLPVTNKNVFVPNTTLYVCIILIVSLDITESESNMTVFDIICPKYNYICPTCYAISPKLTVLVPNINLYFLQITVFVLNLTVLPQYE